MKRILILIGAIYMNFNVCYSQNEKYVIVLDVQKQFYANTSLDSSAKVMLNNINSIIDKSDKEKVIYIKSTNKILSISFKGISVDTMPIPELDSNLKIVSNNIFNKYSGDAFSSSDLTNFLNSNNVKEIILVGLLAERCIYNTAIGGKDRGYNITIIPEAILAKSQKSKEKTIRKLSKKGIKIFQ